MSFNRDGLRHPTHIFEAALWGYVVKVQCGQCRHVALFESRGLWGLFERRNWDDYLWEAKKRFRCATCLMGGKKVQPSHVEFVQSQEPTICLPVPSDITVKRALSRYRA